MAIEHNFQTKPDPVKDRLRVIILCSTCDGEDVGESWSSFQWVHGLSKHCDITLLTYSRPNRKPTSKQLQSVRMVEWKDFPILGSFERFSAKSKPGWWLLYWRARKWIKKAQRNGEQFDLVHQLSPLALRHSCPMKGLGIPYIIGPLAGSLRTPAAFRDEVESNKLSAKLRNLDTLRFKYDPILRKGYKHASIVVGVAPYVQTILAPIGIRRFEIMAETGVFTLPELHSKPPSNDVVRLLYVGRIVRTKGLRDAIRAIARLDTPQSVHLDVVGDGEDRTACENEAHKLGVSNCITFHGKIPRDQVDVFYQSADVFVFPSFREPSGNVLFESMSFGLPVITSNVGGPGYLITKECGIQISPTTTEQYATEIAAAIQTLVDNPDTRKSLGCAARERMASLALWPNKVQWMLSLYNDVVNTENHSNTNSATKTLTSIQ